MPFCHIFRKIFSARFSFKIVEIEKTCLTGAANLFLFQGLDDDSVKAAAIDIFSYIVEFSPSMVREFILQESQLRDDVSFI